MKDLQSGKMMELPDPELGLKGEILVYLLYFFLFVGTVLAAKGNPIMAIVLGMALGFYYVFKMVNTADEPDL